MKTKYVFIGLCYMVSGFCLFGSFNIDLKTYANSNFINTVKFIIGSKDASFGSKEYNGLLLARLSEFENPGLALQSIMQNARKDKIETYIIIVDGYITLKWSWEDTERRRLVYATIDATYNDSWHPITATSGIWSRPLPLDEKSVPAEVFK